VDAAQAMLLSHQAGDSTAWLGQQAANDITCTAGPVLAAAAAVAARVTAVQSTFQLYHSGSA